MFKGPQETVRDNKSSSYPVFELPGVNCTFSDQLLLEDKYFFRTATVMFRRSYLFKISNYSKHVLSRIRQFFRTATFSEEELF